MIDRRIMRRVAGYHDVRLDGMLDLVVRARGASVFDVGCNRGMVGFEMASNGATTVHGCDNYEAGITIAREIFSDIRCVQSQFEVVDLTEGPDCLKPRFQKSYDIVLMLATYHKLKRIMAASSLSKLIHYLGGSTEKFFGWRATSDKAGENGAEMEQLDVDLGKVGLRRVHTSEISDELGLAAIWKRI